MAYLIDTSILGRLANSADSQHSTAARAVVSLHRQGQAMHITGQNLIELHSVATRPIENNGLGLSSDRAARIATTFEESFPLLADTPDIFPAWKEIVRDFAVIGKQVHDARLVAVCHVHHVTHLLTFNPRHFRSIAAYGSGITVVEPGSLANNGPDGP